MNNTVNGYYTKADVEGLEVHEFKGSKIFLIALHTQGLDSHVLVSPHILGQLIEDPTLLSVLTPVPKYEMVLRGYVADLTIGTTPHVAKIKIFCDAFSHPDDPVNRIFRPIVETTGSYILIPKDRQKDLTRL